MAKDVIITPLSGLIDFQSSSTSQATIELDDSNNLKLSSSGGIVQIGNASGDVYIGTGAAAVDIIFQQDGSVRGTGSETICLGLSGDNIVLPSGVDLSIGTTSSAQNATTTHMGNMSFGLPGNGTNTCGRFISIEGNADASGEGSGRIFFTEHNSTTICMSNYGMSIGYRGGSVAITGADGNVWSGLNQISNGQWGMWGHDNSVDGSLIMYGDRGATFVCFNNNNVCTSANMYASQFIATCLSVGSGNSGYLRDVTGDYGSIEVDGGATNGYEGYSIGGRAVFMHDNNTVTGLYNDVNNHWLFLAYHGGCTAMYYNGSQKLLTTPDGIKITDDGSTPDSTTSTFEKGITITGGNMRLNIDVSNVTNGGSYIQTRHASTSFPSAYYRLALNPLGGEVTINGNTAWHAGNDGSGSGLDADLLDGYHQTSFVRLASSSSSPTNGCFAIGTASSRNFIQSHNGQPLDINPLGNTVTIGGTSNTAWHAGNDGSGSGLDADLLDGVHLYQIKRCHSGSDFANGTKVLTSINASPTNGSSFVIEVTGKSYSGSPPFSWIGQGYLYNNTITSCSAGDMTGYAPDYMCIFQDSTNCLAFWWPRVGYWHSFDVHVRDAGGSSWNTVTSITNAASPSGCSKQVCVPIRKSWTDFNDGSGSGLDADLLDGVQSSSFIRSDTADTFTGALTMGTQTALVASNFGHGVFGIYSPTRYQHVWGMGTGYTLPANGLDESGAAGNFYGLAWSYNPDYNYSGSNPQAKSGLGHQLLLMMGGYTCTALGDGIWTSGSFTSNDDGEDRDFRVEALSTSTGPLGNKSYALFVDASAGAVGIGTSQPSYALEVNGTAFVTGTFSAGTKNFLIDHPTRENYMLRHGSLEGPENAVYVRGTTTSSSIELPEYWTGLVDEDTITAALTPRGKYLQLFLDKVEDNEVHVGGTEIGELYDYVIYGTRKDVEDLIVEFERPVGTSE